MPLLTEQKLRIAIREEIENSREYRNLSPRQKQLLEEGVLKKVGSVVGKLVKGAAGIAGGLIKNIFKGLFQRDGQFDKDAKALAAKLTAFQQQRETMYRELMAFVDSKNRSENFDRETVRKGFEQLIYNAENEDLTTKMIKFLNNQS